MSCSASKKKTTSADPGAAGASDRATSKRTRPARSEPEALRRASMIEASSLSMPTAVRSGNARASAIVDHPTPQPRSKATAPGRPSSSATPGIPGTQVSASCPRKPARLNRPWPIRTSSP